MMKLLDVCTKVFLVLSIISCCSFSYASNLEIGGLSPILELPNINGISFNLNSISNKPILLTFFTTWSKTCQENLKFLRNIRDKFKKNIEIVAVALDSKPQALNSFLKNDDFDFTFLTDRKNKSLNDFHVLIIPNTFLIDRDKIIKNIYIDFDEAIEKSISDDVAELLNPRKTTQ